ncbi:hypothetical protein UFOVP51_37 [uncultured Caudovirales phage]|jgi:hypothetical protein|uniref:Uncharacterized protein n=1 Tax=uncultured Caudovirales phage TaxID=2100421 RepID=A0A6J5TA73_9CAUD|nr:hypothetical protein UFOVP51_37 [uncultured Caudovirales phage]CAB4241062.1 hypothetical protein UFOVP34_69 [uncultured Caudovirales phage]
MILQEAFFKFNEIFSIHLIIDKLMNDLKSKRAIIVYYELIKISIQKQELTLLVSYKDLKNKLNYSYESIRKALGELEKAQLIKKSEMHANNIFSVELTHDFWFKELKGII